MDPLISLTSIGRITQIGGYQGEKQSGSQPFLRGQIFQALVAAKTGKNQFTLDLGGRQVTAQSNAQLSVGQQLRLEVAETSPQILLQIQQNPLQQQLGKNIHLLSRQADFLPALRSLASTVGNLPGLSSSSRELFASLQHFLSSQASDLTGSQLKDFINHLGLNLEKQLSTGKAAEVGPNIKSALTEIINLLPSGDKIAEQAGNTLQTLELFQLLQIKQADQALFFYPLPLDFLEYGFITREEKQQEGHGKSQENNYSLRLKLQGLGNIQVDLKQNGEGVALHFYAEDQERTAFMADFRDELREKLTALRLDQVRFLTGVTDPIQELLFEPGQLSSGILDTRA